MDFWNTGILQQHYTASQYILTIHILHHAVWRELWLEERGRTSREHWHSNIYICMYVCMLHFDLWNFIEDHADVHTKPEVVCYLKSCGGSSASNDMRGLSRSVNFKRTEEILTRYLPNTSQKRYSLSQLVQLYKKGLRIICRKRWWFTKRISI
jgi:hypothetical protein